MATVIPETEAPLRFRTLADILDEIGVPAHRILMHPAPGTATIEDLVALPEDMAKLVELIDGVLVEKGVGFLESILDESGTLDGGDVLPGFTLPVREWLERAERPFGGA